MSTQTKNAFIGAKLQEKPGRVTRRLHNNPDVRIIPIKTIEDRLDEDFGFDKWSHRTTHAFTTLESVNVAIVLEVTLPDGNVVSRPGYGSAYIPRLAGTDDSAGYFQKAGALALKNAAKSLGARYGRDLNRDEQVKKRVAVPMSDATKEALRKGRETLDAKRGGKAVDGAKNSIKKAGVSKVSMSNGVTSIVVPVDTQAV